MLDITCSLSVVLYKKEGPEGLGKYRIVDTYVIGDFLTLRYLLVQYGIWEIAILLSKMLKSDIQSTNRVLCKVLN